MGAVRTSYPRFRREGSAPRIELTDDDAEILRRVFRYRFVRADDLYRLFDTRSPDRLSRRLALLYRNHYLDRPIAQVDRYHEGGSKALVYGLDNAGPRYIAESFGYSVSSGDWRARNRTFTRENLDHTLAITRFLVDLERACSSRPDLELIPFEEIVAGAPESIRRLPQPGRWSVPVRWERATVDVVVVPDAIFGLRLAAPDGRKVHSFVFLEIDRGTMTIAPAKQVREGDAFLHRTSILRKLLTYGASHQLKRHAEHLSIPNARVLFLTTSAARAAAMQRAADAFVTRPLGLPPGLFLFGALTEQTDPLSGALTDAAGHSVGLIGT